MKITITTACILLVAALSLNTNPTVEARPLEKRACYNGGKTTFTNYWVPRQGETDQDNDGNKMRLSGSKNKAMKNPNGKTIAMVDKNTFEKCDMEGTCVIDNNGKDTLVNLANDGGSNAKFDVIDQDTPFGLGSSDNSLLPFSTVAANDLKVGTTLYINELDGMKLPNGLTHNGCVVVGDEGWSFDGCQLDLFVLTYENYLAMKTPEKVSVKKLKCKILNYATAEDYKFVGAKIPKNLPGKNRKGGKPPKEGKPPKGEKPSKEDKKKWKKGKKGKNGGEGCDSGSFVKTYSNTGFGGSETCSGGSGCHELNGVTKSSKWSGGKATFYAGSGCTGEALYVDDLGEDADVNGDGKGFHARSVYID